MLIICSLTEIEGIWIFFWTTMCVDGMNWIQPWFQDVQSSGRRTQKGMFVAGLLALPLRHLESRTQGEQNQRPDLIQRCLALIWPFYWLKDWMIQIWLRLLCNMWRLWLYESCSFQFKECADVCQTKLSEVTGRRRRRARAEFEKARRSLFLMQRNLKIFEADAF